MPLGVGLAEGIGTPALRISENVIHGRCLEFIQLGHYPEEVGFWTRKLLDMNVGPKRTIFALCIVSLVWDT